MEALDAIRTRRSVRKFTDKLISKEMIDKLLEAAMSAPSAGNQQLGILLSLTIKIF